MALFCAVVCMSRVECGDVQYKWGDVGGQGKIGSRVREVCT
jgi:hypothetical protein